MNATKGHVNFSGRHQWHSYSPDGMGKATGGFPRGASRYRKVAPEHKGELHTRGPGAECAAHRIAGPVILQSRRVGEPKSMPRVHANRLRNLAWA